MVILLGVKHLGGWLISRVSLASMVFGINSILEKGREGIPHKIASALVSSPLPPRILHSITSMLYPMQYDCLFIPKFPILTIDGSFSECLNPRIFTGHQKGTKGHTYFSLDCVGSIARLDQVRHKTGSRPTSEVRAIWLTLIFLRGRIAVNLGMCPI